MKLAKELKERINYLFDIFNKNNIQSVEVTFYGSGDDGDMELGDVILNDPEGKVVYAEHDYMNWDEPTIFKFEHRVANEHISLYELLTSVSDFLLDQKGIDYCNGSGNNGRITYTIKDKQVHMDYVVKRDAEYSFNVK